jgi:hypothetical protein
LASKLASGFGVTKAVEGFRKSGACLFHCRWRHSDSGIPRKGARPTHIEADWHQTVSHRFNDNHAALIMEAGEQQ